MLFLKHVREIQNPILFHMQHNHLLVVLLNIVFPILVELIETILNLNFVESKNLKMEQIEIDFDLLLQLIYIRNQRKIWGLDFQFCFHIPDKILERQIVFEVSFLVVLEDFLVFFLVPVVLEEDFLVFFLVLVVLLEE